MKLSLCQTLLFAASVIPAFTQTPNLIVLPAGSAADQVNRNATVLNPVTLAPVASPIVGLDAYTALTLPNGSKTYVIARGAANTVTVLSNTASGVSFSKNIDLPAGSTDATLTPDGKRLLIVSINDAAVTVIETVNDNVLVKIPLASPANSVVTNFESTRAFTASPNGAVVTAIDLLTNVVISTLTVPSEITQVGGLGAAPNGLIYLSAVNRLFEIDPRTAQLTPAAAIVMTGSPGRPQFTPDGTRVLLSNFTPISGGTSLILADLVARTTQTASLGGVTLDRIRVVSNNLAYGFAPSTQTLYSINLSPLTATPVSIPGLPSFTNFRGLGGSSESPQNQFLYVANGNTLYKINLATNLVTGTQVLPNLAGTPIGTSLPSTDTSVTNLFAINQQQFVATSGTTLPLVVRALDGNGNPISGATVTFSTTANGVTIANPTILTNSAGYAQTSAVVPAVQSSFNIVATVGVGNTQVFTINVGFLGNGGGGSNGSGKVFILDGNGQIVYSQTPTNKPMRVRVLDANGNPVPTATVIWSLLGGGGTLGITDTLTDADGIASNPSYSAPLLFGNSTFTYPRPSISATTSLGTVTFTHIAIPRILDGTSNPLPSPGPAIALLVPQVRGDITGATGTTIKNAFQFRVLSQGGFSLLQPISGVGVEAEAVPEAGSLDTASSQTARCANSPVTDDKGLVSCDLVVGGKLGRSVVRVTVGAFQSFDFPYIVTQGAPKNIVIISGNNQTGTTGKPLDKALVARLDDGFGSYINGVPVTFTIQSGSATLFQTISTSGIGLIPDPNNATGSISSPGLVSTNLRLGNSPGDVRVRVSISPTVFADFTITNTLTLSTFTKVSGDTQSTPIGTGFAQTLIVEAKDSNGALAPNTPVTFSSNGGVLLSSTVVNTDSTGRAQVTATAGSIVGAYTVTASSGGSSVTFNLNVTPTGPRILSVVNGASFQPGLSPCAIAQIVGSGFAGSVAGTISGQAVVGPLQTSLNGISVQIGGVSLPLFNVSNIAGRETVSFQVPCEQAPGPATLVLRSGSLSVSQDVTIAPYAPGIFQTLDGSGRNAVVAVKANGTYVSPSNPADPDEDIRVFVTGLGQASPLISTNTPGSGQQRVNASVIVGVNNQGITAKVEDTIYAPTLIGVYIVTFHMPIGTTSGTGRPFVVAVQAPDGSFTYSQPAVIDIR